MMEFESVCGLDLPDIDEYVAIWLTAHARFPTALVFDSLEIGCSADPDLVHNQFVYVHAWKKGQVVCESKTSKRKRRGILGERISPTSISRVVFGFMDQFSDISGSSVGSERQLEKSRIHVSPSHQLADKVQLFDAGLHFPYLRVCPRKIVVLRLVSQPIFLLSDFQP
jgi:hypothetical protein